MKKTAKKALSILMAQCMALALMPQIIPKAAAADTPTRTTALDLTASSVAYAGGAETGYPKSGNITDTSEGWAWYYTGDDGYDDKTLVLDGLNLVTSDANALTLPAGAAIVLADGSENIVTSTYCNNGISRGIHGLGSLTIQGSGTLDVTGGNPINDNNLSAGIHLEYAVNGLLTIENGAIVSASGGNTQNASDGIYVNGYVRFSNATVTAKGGTARFTCGLYAVNAEYSGSSSFGSGTVVTAAGGSGGTSLGMQLVGNSETIAVVEDGATITATSGPQNNGSVAANYNAGIVLSNKDLEVRSGGSVTAMCDTDTRAGSGIDSLGIYGGILLNGGVVTASGGYTLAESYGVKGNVRINSGTLTAIGGNGGTGSYGIYSPAPFGLDFAGGTTTAKSATAVATSYAVYTMNSTISDTGMTAKQNGGAGYTIAASHSLDGKYYVYNDVTAATDVLISSDTVASAVAEDTTVSGSVGTALPGSHAVTVTLIGCAFTGLAPDTDASSWFANLPEGLAVTVQSVASGNQSAVFAFSGTPAAASDAAMEITIPSGSLNTGSDLAVTANGNAKFAIIGVTPPAPSFAASGDGSVDDPYEIGNADQLKELAEAVNTQNEIYGDKYYELTDNIVLNESLEGSPEQWMPIGAYEESFFSGVFDGNGHTIRGLYINDTEGELSFEGLFGAVWSATVKNLGLTGGSITAGEKTAVGGIVAIGIQTHIENCYSSCTISAAGNDAMAGGIIGVNSESGLTVVNCYNTGNVTITVSEDGDESCAGGIVGRNIDSSIRNCYSTGAVTGNASGGAVAYAGGIAGKNDLDNEDDGAEIANAYWQSGTAGNGIGHNVQRDEHDVDVGGPSDAGCTSMSDTDMKSAGFAGALNANATALEDDYPDLSAWRAAGVFENGGYPVFGTPSVTYTLTIAGGGTGAAGGGDYEAGASVPVSAGTRSGYTFTGWTTSGGGTFASAGSAYTTFTMPGAAVTITANWTENSTPAGNDTPPSAGGAQVIVNGQSQAAGTSATTTDSNGQTTTTVTVDTGRLRAILDAQKSGAMVIIPVAGRSNVAAGTLTGAMVKSMENKDATLIVQTDSGSYTLPASEINIDAVSQQLGENVSLSDIAVTVSISEPPAETLQVLENAAEDGGFAIVVPAVEYTITCTYGGQTVSVSSFNSYVERTIAIPDGVDPARITTGVVVDPDGTVHHVPTRIMVIGGKYYAVINSLTNSAYSVIWNPVEFSDAADHWAKDAINDMGSRMVVFGDENGDYSPDKNITRAEFAAIIVRALGLAPGTGSAGFRDVISMDWYSGYIETAAGYGIVTGYTDGNLDPNDTIIREQAMTMLARAMKLTGLESGLTEQEINSLAAVYTDGASVSDYAKQGVAACLDAGIVNGHGNGTIAPRDCVTRAEVAVMVERLLKKSGLI